MTLFRMSLASSNKFITARKRSLGQGNIFTPICHSVRGRYLVPGGVPGPGGSTWAGTPTPGPGTPHWDQVPPPGDQVPPRTRYPPGPGNPRDQVTPPGTRSPPELCMLGDTVNKRAVRILLECILVIVCFGIWPGFCLQRENNCKGNCSLCFSRVAIMFFCVGSEGAFNVTTFQLTSFNFSRQGLLYKMTDITTDTHNVAPEESKPPATLGDSTEGETISTSEHGTHLFFKPSQIANRTC